MLKLGCLPTTSGNGARSPKKHSSYSLSKSRLFISEKYIQICKGPDNYPKIILVLMIDEVLV